MWQSLRSMCKKMQCLSLILITYKVLCTGGAYYVPYSFLLISVKFVTGGWGGGSPGRAIKFLYASEQPEQGVKFLYVPAPPPHPPQLGPETSIVGSCTSRVFLGPKWHSPIGPMPFHRAQKLLISRAPPPNYPRNRYGRIQNICTQLYKS
jgi:hypothetical protein